MASHKAWMPKHKDRLRFATILLLKKADVAKQRERKKEGGWVLRPPFSFAHMRAAAQQQLTKNLHPIYALLLYMY